MSTIEDFRNAPVGATATHDNGSRAMKIDSIERYWILKEGVYFSDEQMEYWCWTLDPSPAVPKSAREALDLAWELAHEVKPGRVIPAGTRYLENPSFGVREYTAPRDMKISPALAPKVRTLEPLPEPLLDWLDAPAVLARFDGWDRDEREVFVPTGAPNRWNRTGTDSTFHWSELMDVTPLYPKEDA